MKKISFFFNPYLLLILTVLFTFKSNSQIIVDNNIGVNATYSDLQTAIDDANANDIIYVQPSETNYGNITIDKPLTLIGKSHSQIGVEISRVSTINITPEGSNSTFKGLRITTSVNLNGVDGTAFNANAQMVENIILENCKVYNVVYSDFIRHYNADETFQNGVSANNITIIGNVINKLLLQATNLSISNNWFWGRVTVWRPDATSINHCIFTGQNIKNNGDAIAKVLVQNCLFLANSSSDKFLHTNESQYDNCLTYNYGSGSYDLSTTAVEMLTNNMLFNTNPLFEDLSNGNPIGIFNENNYSLQTTSPAVGSGFNGEDISINGNGFTFNTIGSPAGYPSVKIINSTAIIPNNGILSITIQAKAN